MSITRLFTIFYLAGGTLFASAQNFQRTIAYHQVTAFTESHAVGQDWQRLMSDNGNKIVWEKQTNPKKVIVINPDGSGYSEIVNVGTSRLSSVDISADGTKVVYEGGGSSGDHVNIINANGSDSTQLIALGNIDINTIKISGDGSTVFFCVYRNSTIANGGGSIERGVYMINASGGSHTHVATPAAVASTVGVTGTDVGSFSGGSNGDHFDVSYDGSKMIFMAQVYNQGYYVFTNNGGGATQIYGPVANVTAVGISSDGSKVAFCVSDSVRRGYVANFDGSGLTELANNNDFVFTNGNSQEDQISLTSDGQYVLFDSPGHLFKTDGTEVIDLSANTAAPAGRPLINGDLLGASMSSDASRVLFSFLDPPNNIYQLAVLDINPTSLGGSPAISDVYMTPNAVSVSPITAAEISARITPANSSDSVWYVGNVILKEGLQDSKVPAKTFYDDGSSAGDQVADDNNYTHNGITPYSDAEVGPRILRINAEVFDDDGMLHGIAVDVANPFQVAPDTVGLSIEDVELGGFSLSPGYPNPFSSETVITYRLKENAKVRISVFNYLGALQAVLLDKEVQIGEHQLKWNGSDAKGNRLVNGVYFVSLEADGKILTQKVVLQR